MDNEESDSEDKGAYGNEDEVAYTVHALAGYSNPQTMIINGFLKYQPVIVLIDLGSTNYILDEGICKRLSILVEHCEQFKVKLTD